MFAPAKSNVCEYGQSLPSTCFISAVTFSIMDLIVVLSIMTLSSSMNVNYDEFRYVVKLCHHVQYRYAECCYTECCGVATIDG